MNTIITYIYKMFQTAEKPQTYGSALETYIVSKNPTSTAEVEHWTQEFDRQQARQVWDLGGRYVR